MFSTVTEYVSKNIKNKNGVAKQVEDIYLNTQYRGGIIEEINLINENNLMLEVITGSSNPYRCNLQIDFNIFSFPCGFYVPNARVAKISANTQTPTNIVFSCDLIKNNGDKIKSSEFIFSVITSDNKTSAELQRLSNLTEDSCVNLVCLNQLSSNANKCLALTADIMKKIQPILFTATDTNAKLFNFHANKELAGHICDSTNIDGAAVTELNNGSSYYLTPLGFYATNKQGAEFLADSNGVAGFKTLNEYLLACANNWYFLINNNEKLPKETLNKLMQFYEF
jgi:hypothetical protein